MNSIRFLLLLLLSAVLLSFQLPAARADGPWRVGTWRTAQTIQPFFYERFAGHPVTVLPFTNPADQKAALLAGSLDACGTTLVHAIASASRGEPVVVVAALCNKCSALVVRADGPFARVEDLRGRRIGYVPGTMHEILLREQLLRAGLSPERDVKLVRVDFFDMAAALKAGSIDAFLSGEPFPSLAESEGYGRILGYPYFDDGVGTINAAILVTREAVAKRPDEVLALVRAHALATRHLERERGEWLMAATGFGTPRPVQERASSNVELAWDMDGRYLDHVRALGARMKAMGVIEREPDYETLVDLSFATRVREELRARQE